MQTWIGDPVPQEGWQETRLPRMFPSSSKQTLGAFSSAWEDTWEQTSLERKVCSAVLTRSFGLSSSGDAAQGHLRLVKARVCVLPGGGS